MALSHPGLTGAIGGLAMGAADFIIVLRVIRRVLAREMDEGRLRSGLQAAAGRLPFLPTRAGLSG